MADELKTARALEDVYRRNISTAADLLNQWCRELGIEECRCPWGEHSLRTAIGRVRDKVAMDRGASGGEAKSE